MNKLFVVVLTGLAMLLSTSVAQAARISKIWSTKHNLSTSGPGTLKAATETEVCVFCHTPHGSTNSVTPLWNRSLSAASYIPYSSNSLDATVISNTVLDQPGGSSKLCLSCHDGTMAIGQVNVLRGEGSPTTTGTRSITMNNTSTTTTVGAMAPGSGTTTGFTRNLGTDLSNDHPISLTYTSALVTRDGELRAVAATTQRDTQTSGTLIGVRTQGYKPLLPLESTGTATEKGQIQCATCHDPHIFETDVAGQGNQKFLRLNRFQTSSSGTLTSTIANFNVATDQICIACHDKNGSNGSWAFSAHANNQVAGQTYLQTTSTLAAGLLRDFPANLPVWRAACLNCHDTHTVQGAGRLLREGVDSVGSPKTGGNSAIEETCYQCHTSTATTILQGTATATLAEVPNIKSDFDLLVRMPITGSETGKHDIGGGVGFNDGTNADCRTTVVNNKCGADFLESKALLATRHAECTDCHNPHRVIKGQNGLPGTLTSTNTNEKAGTHRHEDATGYVHSNIISGVLRGAWGVEPAYSSPSFHLTGSPTSAILLNAALTFTVKRGDPGTGTADSTVPNDAVLKSYVTREYQICLKCHSNYGYPDTNDYPFTGDSSATGRPQIGASAGGTTAAMVTDAGHLNFTSFTNQAKEFQAPTGHRIQVGAQSLGTEAGASLNANNHRSWHPVIGPTGRTTRQANGFLPPWNNANALGVQTMYCSDCHGSATAAATNATPSTGTVMPISNTNNNENGNPWGPHGSGNTFLLKGTWSTTSGEGDLNTLCFKCHSYRNYATSANRGSNGSTGFATNDSEGDGHALHSNRISTDIRCNWCHVAVPHGWKNRGLLVNLNDLGPEVGKSIGTSAPSTPYTNGPYYRRAFLRINSFPTGQWSAGNCMGGKGGMTDACSGPTN